MQVTQRMPTPPTSTSWRTSRFQAARGLLRAQLAAQLTAHLGARLERLWEVRSKTVVTAANS